MSTSSPAKDKMGKETNLDSVLGEHGAVELDRGQAELLCDLGVLDLAGLLEGHALDVLGDERRRGNGRSASVLRQVKSGSVSCLTLLCAVELIGKVIRTQRS